tara:strand:- start:68 stop:805 length:738 start_codon:yes stop_codon:yes gene_type:complete
MRIACIVPARMGSSRFPGKPLAKILGKEMILHVCDNCKKSKIIDDVIVATCDGEIEKCIRGKYKVVMTSNLHERASDRCAEAVRKLNENGDYYDYVVMVQGDEPMIKGSTIDKLLEEIINNQNVNVINGLGELIVEDLSNPNTIKVLLDQNSYAIYMTRNIVPYKPIINENVWKQVCIIPFKTEVLLKYSDLKPTPLEISESVDMNRLIEHGFKIKMIRVDEFSHAVDSPQDLLKVEGFMKKFNS